MPFRPIRAALALLPLIAFAAPAMAGTRGIAGFRAYLFDRETGRMSPEIFRNNVELGFAPVGDYKSDATFVVVAVDSGPALAQLDGTLHFTATDNGKPIFRAPHRPQVLVDSTQRVSFDNDLPGVVYVGFWLAHTGCDVIDLRAAFTIDGKRYIGKSQLPFVCNE